MLHVGLAVLVECRTAPAVWNGKNASLGGADKATARLGWRLTGWGWGWDDVFVCVRMHGGGE